MPASPNQGAMSAVQEASVSQHAAVGVARVRHIDQGLAIIGIGDADLELARLDLGGVGRAPAPTAIRPGTGYVHRSGDGGKSTNSAVRVRVPT